MDKEIEIGDYIRTKNGNFGKVIDISNVTNQAQLKYLIKWSISKAYYITKRTIIKHSKNIIDLIEEGDYVNGHLVLKVEEDGFLLVDDKGYTHLAPINIKSIVTKEQFAQREYKVKE